MTETTHEALVRQTGAAEELLDYFQGQRATFRADVAQAQADYVALSSDLVGIVDDKLTHKYYIDNVAGDDTASGSTVSPLATIQEAFSRLVPGSSAEIRLMRGQTYAVSREANCRADNAFVSFQVWGDVNLEKPLIEHSISNLNGAAYSDGFSGSGLNLFFLSCKLSVGLNPDALPVTTFNGFFTGTNHSSVTLKTCDIELGDVALIKASYNTPAFVSVDGCDITRKAGSTGKFLTANAGVFRSNSTTRPADEEWSDLISGQVYAADGEARNFATNVQI